MTSVSVNKTDDFPTINKLEGVTGLFNPGESTIYDCPRVKGNIMIQHPLYPLTYYDNLKKQFLL